MARRYRLKKKIRQKRKRLFLKKGFWLFFLIFLMFGTFFYYFFYSGLLEIKEIEVNTDKEELAQKIEEIIEKEKQEKFLFFIPKNIFLLDLKKIKNEISEKIPSVEEIILERDFPHLVKAAIVEKTPLALWCAKNKTCFYLDEKGVIFEEAGESEKEEMPIIKSEKNLKLGEKAVSKEELKSLLNIYNELNSEIKIKEIFISSRKIAVRVFPSWEIYFDWDNVERQLLNLKAVLEQKIPEKLRKNLQYIDLRFGNKVYYKFID